MLPNKFTTLRKNIYLRLRGQAGAGAARLFDILLWSSELAAKRSLFRSQRAVPNNRERIPNCRLASLAGFHIPPASMLQALRRYPRSTLPDGQQCTPREA
jgi:hypothetical protein